MTNEELLKRLAKPVMAFDKIEHKLVSDWNKKEGTSFKTMREINDSTGWSKRFDNDDWDSGGILSGLANEY